MGSLLVTGANGHLGRRLIAVFPPTWPIEALVRSEHARRTLARHVAARPGLTVTVADPGDADAVAALASRCDAAVHLIGTLKESRDNPYVDAHQRPARALAEAAARGGLRHVVYLSILGAHAASPSRCLRARAAVEDILRQASAPATVIRVPMVLGEGDRASRALARQASAAHVFLLRAASLEQPIYAGDVVRALTNALRIEPPADRVLELAGPESLPRRELVARAGSVLGRRPVVHSLPLWTGLAAAAVLERVRASPPLTRDMLRVLDHDDAIDPRPAAHALGVALTPLDETLGRCLAPSAQDATR